MEIGVVIYAVLFQARRCRERDRERLARHRIPTSRGGNSKKPGKWDTPPSYNSIPINLLNADENTLPVARKLPRDLVFYRIYMVHYDSN